MNKNTLPFTPESMEKLKARYPDAVMYTWIYKHGIKDHPGLHREHLFDCEDGLCMCISKEMMGPMDVIHFSCDIHKETYDKNFTGIINAELLAKFEARFREISGEKKPVHLLTISPYGNPHFIVVEKGMAFGLGLSGEELDIIANPSEQDPIPPLPSSTEKNFTA